MESKAKFLGHPLHPILIVFPLGLLVTAIIFDIIYFITGNTMFATAAFWNIAAGIIGGLAAAIFGFIDWIAIPNNTRAKSIGFWHGAGNIVLMVLFAVSWIIRYNNFDYLPDALAFTLVLIGGTIGLVTGWLGGELVDRLGVGVDKGANLNSPNSLTGKPADSNLSEGQQERLRERQVGG